MVCRRKQQYWCYYPHRLRDSVSPVCGIFIVCLIKYWLIAGSVWTSTIERKSTQALCQELSGTCSMFSHETEIKVNWSWCHTIEVTLKEHKKHFFSLTWFYVTYTSRSEQAPGSVFHLRDKSKTIIVIFWDLLGAQCVSLCLWMAGYQLSSHLLSLAAGRQVVVSNVFGALLQAA